MEIQEGGLVENESVSVYERMREIEEKRKAIDKAKSLLAENEFKVEGGDYPSYYAVLEEMEYKFNRVVKGSRTGRRIEDMVDKIASERKNGLRFNKAERKKYNERVEVLNDVVDASGLKSDGALSFNEYGGPILGGLACGAISWLTFGSLGSLIADNNIYRIIPTFLFGSTGMLVPALTNFENSLNVKETIQRIKEKAKYIDNLLESEMKGYFDNSSESVIGDKENDS